ncbi:rhodanese-like domain-containing protein [Xanthomarina sp. GH4-25]|uniref:rhodanese-like domain-containing protein n=1 Tax=Xanthomarina sp. GH4-25 TaxID=3349335 RepID=UPI000D684C68|nr:rhodanese-like domain-containing protein [Flavobacteriaceae bacterium LYZ1037]
MKHILIVLLLITSVYNVKAQEKDNIVLLNLTEFKSQIENKDVQLIDVRTPKEFEEGHIEDALNIDFYSEKFVDEFNKLDKEKPVYLYCRSGFRSKQSALKLSEMGFKTLYDLEGGFLNYNKKDE